MKKPRRNPGLENVYGSVIESTPNMAGHARNSSSRCLELNKSIVQSDSTPDFLGSLDAFSSLQAKPRRQTMNVKAYASKLSALQKRES